MIGIYKITSPSGKIYIGQSVDIEKRIAKYRNLNCKKQIKLYRSLIKYGFDDHIKEVIEECNIDDLNDRERFYQDKYNCVEEGLNCVLTKSKDKSGRLTLEHREKISKAGKNPPLERRMKISIALKGKNRTEETKIKISNSHKGKTHTKETRLKISENSRNISDETRRKYSESHLGHTHSIESRTKISIGLKGKNRSEETKIRIAAGLGKKVLNTETGEIYLSVAKASKATGNDVGYLHLKLKGLKENNTNLIFYTNE